MQKLRQYFFHAFSMHCKVGPKFCITLKLGLNWSKSKWKMSGYLKGIFLSNNLKSTFLVAELELLEKKKVSVLFRWGRHLSICPFVAQNISGNVHHLILIFGTNK